MARTVRHLALSTAVSKKRVAAWPRGVGYALTDCAVCNQCPRAVSTPMLHFGVLQQDACVGGQILYHCLRGCACPCRDCLVPHSRPRSIHEHLVCCSRRYVLSAASPPTSFLAYCDDSLQCFLPQQSPVPCRWLWYFLSSLADLSSSNSHEPVPTCLQCTTKIEHEQQERHCSLYW